MKKNLKSLRSGSLSRNKRGLSAVVTTLIIIILVFVAIGIIWVVIRDVFEGGAADIELSSKCLDIDVSATAVVNTSDINYIVTLKRGAGGDVIDGVKIVLLNDTGSSNVITEPGDIEQLRTVTKTIIGVVDSNKVETTVYFTDASGNDKPCPQTDTFSF